MNSATTLVKLMGLHILYRHFWVRVCKQRISGSRTNYLNQMFALYD